MERYELAALSFKIWLPVISLFSFQQDPGFEPPSRTRQGRPVIYFRAGPLASLGSTAPLAELMNTDAGAPNSSLSSAKGKLLY